MEINKFYPKFDSPPTLFNSYDPNKFRFLINCKLENDKLNIKQEQIKFRSQEDIVKFFRHLMDRWTCG